MLQFALRAARAHVAPIRNQTVQSRGCEARKQAIRVARFGDLPQPGYGEEISIPGLPDNIKGTDVTKSDAKMANYKADLTRSEFESRALAIGLDERTGCGWEGYDLHERRREVYREGRRQIDRRNRRLISTILAATVKVST